MYGISTTTDFGFLLGKMVEQVCLGQYQTQIHLDDASIRIECKHALVLADERREIVWERAEFPSDGISNLLGQTLSSVSVVSDARVEFTFSRGDRLLLFDDSDQYESFHVVCGELEIVV